MKQGPDGSASSRLTSCINNLHRVLALIGRRVSHNQQFTMQTSVDLCFLLSPSELFGMVFLSLLTPPPQVT